MFKRRLQFEGALEPRRCLAASDVMISEIMYHPAENSVGLEFIELHNGGVTSTELTGWQLTTGVEFTLPQLVLTPGSFLVIAADVAQFAARHPDVQEVIGGWKGRLANRGEAITLVDAAGNQIDRVRYADEGDWGIRELGPDDEGHRGWIWNAPHDGGGSSLELRNPQLPNELGQNWGASLAVGGSPGRPNSMLTDNVAPLLVDLVHSPALPKPTERVTVSVTVVDEQSTAKWLEVPTLFYRQNITGDSSLPYTSIPLNDQGEHGDLVAGDDIFSAQIPPLPRDMVVEYYVRGTDEAGQVRRVPSFSTDDVRRTANQLYQVLDVDADTSPEGWDPNSQPITYLIMTPAESAELADIGDGPLLEASSNARMNGTYVRVDGNGVDVRHLVGIRNRGGSSRLGPPNNYRIEFPHDRPLDGAVSLNVNSRFIHAQVLGSAIFQLARMPAAEGVPIQVRVNGENLAEPGGPLMFGSYAQMEVVSGSFPDRYFPLDSKGNLYRVVESGSQTGNLRYEGPDPSAYQDTYLKRTNEEDDDWSDLIRLVDELNNAPQETYLRNVESVVNVNQWLRFLALDSLLGNLETGLNVGAGDKFWLYRGTEDTRFQLIPHDLDTILGIGRLGQPNRSIFAYTAVPGLQRFLTHPDIVPRYYQAFADLLADVFTPSKLFPLLDHLLGDFVLAEELQSIRQFIEQRIEGVRAQLPDEFVISSQLPIVAGYPRTTQPVTELFGTANARETRSIIVDGHLANWSPFTREWSITTSGEGETVSLIDFRSDWKYLDNGSSQSGNWRQIDFNDVTWRTGSAPLGYGNGDEQTKIGFGPNPNDKYISSYFRREFQVADPQQILDLTLRLQRDDGAIVYLNGQEVVRSNMPTGMIDFQTVASSWIGGGLEQQISSYSLDPALLRGGKNVLAVEVHQRSAADDDLRLDLRLEAQLGTIAGGIPLQPGINRLLVQAFDEPGGLGKIVDSGSIDVWYDGSRGIDPHQCSMLASQLAPARLDGVTLTRNTVMAPCGPAYVVTGQLTVPQGVTLTIHPGTTIFFAENAGLSILGGGLIAEGTTFAPIRLTSLPSEGKRLPWSGVQFVDTLQDNRLTHTVVEYGATDNGMVGLLRSRLTVENSTFDHSDRFRIRSLGSSLVVRNTRFEDLFAPDEPPTTDNASEHIWGSGILVGGEFLLEGNYFGTTSGHNDAIDFDGGVRPGPIPIIRNNFFAGAGDDLIDLETDAHIEGNVFQNVRKDRFNTSTGEANAISAGGGRDYVVVRNVFWNVDHAVQVKDEAFLTFQHNTVSQVRISPIYFDLPDRSPGRGARVEDSIFNQTPILFGAADQARELSVDRSIVTPEALSLGTGNVVTDPRFVDAGAGDFRLGAGSPAHRTALHGRDRGALVSQGLSIFGEPSTITYFTSATLQVAGPGMIQYRFRTIRNGQPVSGGEWSNPVSISLPIDLRNLTAGQYEVEVIGLDSAGIWQHPDQASRSRTWRIEPNYQQLRIHEVLANNGNRVKVDGNFPDLIELHNDGPLPIDLTGMTMTDDPDAPAKHRFPAGVSLAAGGYLVLIADGNSGAGPLHLGFQLSSGGESLELRDRSGILIDRISYGMQLPSYSIGRIGHDRGWTLNLPTLGGPNQSVTTGDSQRLRINEWLAHTETRRTSDFVEIYNSDNLPVDLGGLYFSDDPVAEPRKFSFPRLSFVAGNGLATFDTNGGETLRPDEIPFGLNANGETLALLRENSTGDLVTIDQVRFLTQTSEHSQGRSPDGADTLRFLPLATPGLSNPVESTSVNTLIPFDAPWRYEQNGNDLGTTWRNFGYDDASWSQGQGPFGVSPDSLPLAIATPLRNGITTHYFRHELTLDERLFQSDISFQVSTLLDDGAVIYVNGVDVLRVGMADGSVSYATRANRGIGVATVEGPFVLDRSHFVPGRNLIAVELHQVSPGSLDSVFALRLTAESKQVDAVSKPMLELQKGLRITEVMYAPQSDRDAEFIELTNVASTTLGLAGVRITGGVELTFTDIQLAPGEVGVAVRDAAVFRRIYGPTPRILGQFEGRLANEGEPLDLLLPAPWEVGVLRFSYSPEWYPETVEGYSLRIRYPDTHFGLWSESSSWQVNSKLGGSPGVIEPGLAGDINRDTHVNDVDVDLLCFALQQPSSSSLRHDVNLDGSIDRIDLDWLVESILQTVPGDANVDGRVGFDDFLNLAAHFGRAGVWSMGDFGCDGQVDFADFLALAQNFGRSKKS